MNIIPVNRPMKYPEAPRILQNVYTSGWTSGEGSYVTEFENKFSAYCGVKYGVTTNSGTTALHLALATLGITKGDEVILPAMTIASCYFAIWYVGAKAIPVDIETDTYAINPRLIEQQITKKTKAIMVVHLYGHPCDMDPILAIAKKHHLYIIEDAAEAHGAEYKGKRVGSFGNVAIFSFYANKLLSCGEGGMLITNDGGIAKKAQSLKNLAHVPNKRFTHFAIGFRYQMTNMQAALGLIGLKHIEESIIKKRKMAALYSSYLSGVPGIILPTEKQWAKSVFWMYGVRIQKNVFGFSRSSVMQKLADANIQTRTFFYSPKTAFKKLPMYKNTYFPIAERVEKEGLYLPSGLGNTSTDLKRVARAIKCVADDQSRQHG